MHPLPAAQATAASLHALLPPRQPSSPDEQLLIDAIIALRRWANPDQRRVPITLRLQRSLPLRIRVRSSSSEATVVAKRGKRRNIRSGRGRRSANTELRRSQGTRQSVAGKPNSARGSLGESKPQSSSNPDSQVLNSSDLSTEPPEGWPKLAELPSPVLEQGSTIFESEKDQDKDGAVSGTLAIAKQQREIGTSQSPLFNVQSTDTGSRKTSPHSGTNAASPVESTAKRRRVSPSTSCKVRETEQGKPEYDGPTSSSDSPNSPPSRRASERHGETQAQDASVHKKCPKKRKNSAPKRRRPTSPGQNPGPSFITESENDKLGDSNGFLDSPPPSFDVESPGRTRSAESVHSVGYSESPAISVTQKSKEHDTDSHSDKSDGPANSLGSVVVGGSSYDGRSIDMGYDRTQPKHEDLPSRPSSVVWNESNVESIEEPPIGDQSTPLCDSIEETEKMRQSELQESADKSHHSGVPQDHGESNSAHQGTKTGRPTDKRSPSDELIAPAALQKDPLRSKLNDSKNTYTTPTVPHPTKYGHLSHIRVSTPLVSGRSIPDMDKTNDNHRLPSHTSPVSPDEPIADCKKSTERTHQQAKASCTSETIVEQMVVCIAKFAKDIESELAHEIVMRLGGEIVTDFESAQPECVVASVDPQTQEVVNRDLEIQLALALRVPIVGLSWLTQCFKSGCWVDSKDFETRSSRLKPSPGVFTGVLATFEDAFSRKNAKRLCREYHDDVTKLIRLAGGVITEKSNVVGITQNDKSIRLHIQIAYDFDNCCLNTAPQKDPDGYIPMRIVNESWIAACFFSGQCPPP